MNKKERVILDTDIGDDIDDAFALYLLLQEKRAKLLGVTTVFRNARQRAKMASFLISTFKKKVPVYAGCDEPLIAKVKNLIPPEIQAKETKDKFGKYYIPQFMGFMEDAHIEEKHAVDFIIESIHKYPQEVTIFGIGPLTNIAMAIRKDPSIVPLIKEIRIMGGDPTNINIKEWNIFCDPEAAHIVFDTKVPIYEVGLNVTLKCQLTQEYRDILTNIHDDRFTLLTKMMEKWFKHYEFTIPVMHDPLAVATMFGDFCEFEKLPLTVGLENEKRALTYCDKIGNDVYSAKKVNVDAFFKYFIKTIFEIDKN